SFNVFYYYYVLNGWYLELIGNFEARIKSIEACEKLLQAGKINVRRFDSALNKYTLIYALFRAKQYDKGLKLAPMFLSDFKPYSRKWFTYMEHYFLLAMHAEKYSLAVDIVVDVNLNPHFKHLNN